MKLPKRTLSIPWRMYLLVGCSGIVVAGMVAYSLYLNIQLDSLYMPRHEAIMQLRIDATAAQLAFEEIISGDKTENVEQVWRRLQRAKSYAYFMLEGGQIDQGVVIPLADQRLRAYMEFVHDGLEDYKEFLHKRMIAHESSLPGSVLDQRSDSLFASVMDTAKAVETLLHRTMAGELRQTRILQIILMILSLFLAVLVGILLHRHIQRREIDLATIRQAMDELGQDTARRRQAENAMRREQERAQEYLDVAGVMMTALDVEGKITLINQKGCEVLEAAKSELIGKNWFDNFLPENMRREVRGVFDSLMAGERDEVEYFENHIVTARGREKIIRWHNTYLTDEAGNLTGTLSSGEDITERKRAEEALRASETSLASIFRAAPIGIGLVSNRILKQVNDQMCALVGYTREELVGNSSRMVYPSDEEFEFVGREKYRQIQEYGTGTVETRWRRKDGVIINVLLSSTPVDPADPVAGVTFTALDITERVQAEKTLRESEEKWRSLAESSPDHIMNLDQDGKIRFINFTVNDLTAEGVLERPIYDFIPENYRGEVKACLERVRKTGQPDSYATEYKHSDGTMLYFSSTVGPILLDEKVSGFTVSSRDVTSAKQAEAALQKAHDELELRVKQRTLELSKVNRDLKKQIQVREKIEKKLRKHQQELQTLASELSLAEERERRRFAENLHDTISQSLVMAHMKLESLTVDTLSEEVSDSIRQINQMVGQALENTQTLTFELSPPVLHRLGLGPAVESLADRLHSLHGLKVELVDHGPTEPLAENIGVLLFRAIRELLINVIKHAGMRTAKVTITAESGNVMVDVEDQGAGFDPSAQNDPPRREGFGLLNIQERLTHLGGSCTIQSKPGKGTRITLSAPLVTAGKIAEGKYV